MRMLVKIAVVLALLVAAYIAYQVLVKKKPLDQAIKDTKDATKSTPLSRGHMLYKTSKYADALKEFHAATTDQTLSEDDKAEAMRYIGNCYYKQWEWENNAASVPKARDAWNAYAQKYPKDYKEHEGEIKKSLTKMGALTGGK